MKVDLIAEIAAKKRRSKNREGKKKRKFKNRLLVKLIKQNSWCEDCGSTEELTFHHRNPKKKKGCVCDIATQKSLGRTIKELNKCDIICRTCHDRRDGMVR